MQGQLEEFMKLFFSESGTFDLRTEEIGRDFTMQGDNEDGEAGFSKGDMAAFGLTGHKAGPHKRTDCLAPWNPSQARHTRTSTWLVSTSGSVAISSWRATFR